MKAKRTSTVKTSVDPFVPVNIPQREKKNLTDLETSAPQPEKCGNKEILIHIDKDDKNKECLKKLFKKVHKLTDDLAAS